MSGSTQLTPTTFRALMPEFNDAAAYPDPLIQFWLTDSYANMNPFRWGQMLQKGAMYYTAHYLVLAQRNKLAAARGQAPGTVQGPLQSKGAGGVSASFNTGAVASDGMAGAWNQTTYGIEFWRMLMIAGAGGAQVTGVILEQVVNGPPIIGGFGIGTGDGGYG